MELGGRRHQISNFTQIYYNYADSVILGYLNETEIWRISRARIEMQILKMIDKERIPVAYRLAMFCMVTNTDLFEHYWMDKRHRLDLDKQATARLRPDYDLVFDLPPLNPPQSPTGSYGMYSVTGSAGTDYIIHETTEQNGVETTGPNDVSEFEWEVFDVSTFRFNPDSTDVADDGTGASDADVSSVTLVSPAISPVISPVMSPVVEEFTPAPTPAPAAVVAEPSPDKKKRTYTRNRHAITEPGEDVENGPPAKKPRTARKIPARDKAAATIDGDGSAENGGGTPQGQTGEKPLSGTGKRTIPVTKGKKAASQISRKTIPETMNEKKTTSQTGSKTVAQTKEMATRQTGEKTVPQTGEKDIPKTGDKTIPKSGNKTSTTAAKKTRGTGSRGGRGSRGGGRGGTGKKRGGKKEK